jgi:ABC-type cobalamin/Fe3+-siderophores transport system ATPase subunit
MASLIILLLLLSLPPALPFAGKSSLIGALFRLTEIESGLITIDGVNTKALELRQLRASMALIPQLRLARHS